MIQRRRLRLGAAALCILAATSPAQAAVDDYLGKPVASVRLVLDGRDTTDPAFVEVVETRVGRPLSMSEVRESITHLFSLGRFESVRIDASMTPAGVALRYELSPIHLVSKIEFTGSVDMPGVDLGQLRRAIALRYGASPPLGRAGDVSALLAESLRQRGYRHPTVKPRADIGRESAQATLVFDIDPGPRTVIGSIEVNGTPALSREDFLDRLNLSPGRPYQPDVLEERITSFVGARRKDRYYEARVTPSVSFADDERVANLTLIVEPGPRVRVTYAGDSLPDDQLADLVPIEREGSADEDLLEDASARIEEYLREQGYREATAPHTRTEAEGELLITFTVHKGPQYRVSLLEISGDVSVPRAVFQPALRLRVAAPFSSARLEGDVATIESLYRRQGFRAVQVRPALEPLASSAGGTQVPVVVRLAIVEGVRTVVGEVRIEGTTTISGDELRRGLQLQPGAPYFEPQLQSDRDAIELRYANLGFRMATVDARPDFTSDGTQANLVFMVQEGVRIFLDHVLISGNLRTSADTIERELQVKPGEPLGLAAYNDSKRRLSALGLFRRVEITELRHNVESQRDWLITVEESPPTVVGYGGGLEVLPRVVRESAEVAEQKIEIAPRAFFDIGRRNLFGKNRSVNLATSIALYPRDSPFFSNPAEAASDTSGGLLFAQYRVVGTLREPRVFNSAFEGQLTAFAERQIRSSFNLDRRGATAQLARSITRSLSIGGGYQIQRTKLLDVNVASTKQSDIDRVFTQLRLSSFSTSVTYSTRDDALDPTNGEFLNANAQLAARSIGSEVGFLKSLFTAQAYRPMPGLNRLVLAGSARLGLATGFPRDVVSTDAEGQPVVEVRDLPQAERFFAGGDTTIRGFAPDTVGAPDTIKDGFPIGGNALVLFNGELRLPVIDQRLPVVGGRFTLVGFFDTGNVFTGPADLSLRGLRSAAGFGIRFGPLRVDWGYKLDNRPGDLARPDSFIALGASAAYLSFGQAF